MQIFALTGSIEQIELTSLENKIISLLNIRPHSIDELAIKTDILSDRSLPLRRLEENFIIQRCGLTLTDLLHITGQFDKWDKHLSDEYCRMMQMWPMPSAPSQATWSLKND